MVTKKFKAPTMLAALQEVQRTLGPDAIVVSMRQIPAGPIWQVWKKPGYEVIAMVPDKPASSGSADKTTRQTTAAANANSKSTGRETIQWVIPDLEKQPEAAAVKPTPKPGGQTAGAAPAAATTAATAVATAPAARTAPVEAPVYIPSDNTLLGKTRSHLIAQGVDQGLVDQIVAICHESLSPASLIDEKRLLPYMQKQFEIRLKAIDRSVLSAPRRIIAVVGPNGSGKTSSCAKMATHYVLDEGKSVAWICGDTIRTAAISEARTYTESLGISMYTAYTTEDVKFSIEQASGADVILIDTTGCSAMDEDGLVEMGTLIADIPNRVTLLTTPASTKEADLNQSLASFGAYNLKGVLVTKMDETTSFGSIFNTVWRSQLPLAYYSTGSKIMGSLKQGNPAFLINAMFNGGIGR